MALKVEHELHHRRAGRNRGLLLILLCFVALVFVLTVVKVTQLGDLKLDDRMTPQGISVPDPDYTPPMEQSDDG